MTRILLAAAFAAVLPLASFAQDAAQLRETVAASAIMHELNADVAAMTDEQVAEAYAVLQDATMSDEDKKRQLEAMFATDVPQ